MKNNSNKVKYVFVFGGVLSGLGKGIVASSLGYLFKSRGYISYVRGENPYSFPFGIYPKTFNNEILQLICLIIDLASLKLFSNFFISLGYLIQDSLS